MLSVTDANGERRISNFIRDTATTVVVAPRVVITLHAEPAKLEIDSSWRTVLTVKTKNIGELDLTGSQALLNLRNVFPAPVTYIIDSIRYSTGNTVRPNNNYDGIQSTDLFARINQTKNQQQMLANGSSKDRITDDMIVAPDGVSNLSRSGMELWIPNGNNNAADAPQLSDDGHSLYMFGPQSSLPVGAEADIWHYIHLKPNGYTQPFIMQAVALGTGSTQGATALATSLSNDNNNIASHPEISKTGEPTPTVIALLPNPVVGVSLAAATPVLQSNGTYNVSLTYKVKNYGNTNLQSVQLIHNLSRMIGAPSVFTITGGITTTGNLVANSAYDGKLDSNILAPNVILGLNGEGTVQFTINITPNQLSSIYRLQATAIAISDANSSTVTDLSTDGANPDPDNNNIPDEKIITVITINLPVPPLVTGAVGILTNPATRSTVPAKGYCSSASGVTVVSNATVSGGTGPYQFQWQRSTDNISFTNIAGATDSIYTTGTVTGNLYLRRMVISDNQVGYTNSVFIQIYTVVKPVITAGGPLTLPQNGSVTLTSSTASSYLWSNNATTASVLVTVGTVGSYKGTATDANGCSAVSDSVVVLPPPPVTINATYIIGATNNPANSGVQVTGFTGAKLNYYLLSAGGVLIPVPSLPTAVGVYTYYVSQTINVYESARVPYTVTMLDPAKVADLIKVQSKAPVLQSDGSFIMAFTFKASNLRTELLDSIKIKDDLTKVFPGSVQYSIVDIQASGKLKANGSFNGTSNIDLLADVSQLSGFQTDSVMLTLKVIPNGFAGVLNNTAVMTAKSPYGIFNITSNDTTQGNGASVRNPTKFTIPVVDIFIPEGFSPNHDGTNDFFVITRPFNTNISLEMFNRWGNLVYKSGDYKNTWDGKGNQPNNVLGEDLPDGTYYYIVLATNTTTGTVRKFVGFITLKRYEKQNIK